MAPLPIDYQCNHLFQHVRDSTFNDEPEQNHREKNDGHDARMCVVVVCDIVKYHSCLSFKHFLILDDEGIEESRHGHIGRKVAGLRSYVFGFQSWQEIGTKNK